MNIIEGLKRGEGVVINHTVQEEHSRRYLSLNKSLEMRIEGVPNGLYKSAYIPNSQEEHDGVN